MQVLLERLTQILTEVQKNPRNPMFNHYLFETIAVLVRNVCAQNRAQVDAFEQVLFGPFEVMLSMESCTEFGPYVFQILGQLLQMHDQVLLLLLSFHFASFTACLTSLRRCLRFTSRCSRCS